MAPLDVPCPQRGAQALGSTGAHRRAVPTRALCAQVRVVHSGNLHLPLRLKAFAIVHDEMQQIREWLPEELKDSGMGGARSRMLVELKGSTVVSYVFQTATVRPARCAAPRASALTGLRAVLAPPWARAAAQAAAVSRRAARSIAAAPGGDAHGAACRPPRATPPSCRRRRCRPSAAA